MEDNSCDITHIALVISYQLGTSDPYWTPFMGSALIQVNNWYRKYN